MPFELKINESLSLRIPSVEDARDIYTVIDNDREHLRKWLPWVDSATSYENTEENIKQRIEDFNAKKAASFLIYYEGQWIGSVGFVCLSSTSHHGEIGYWLCSKFEGKGLMTESVKACIKYGFDELGLNRVVIKCDSQNVKSAAIPKRLGFIQEGILRQDKFKQTKYSDTLVFGLLKEEWKGELHYT